MKKKRYIASNRDNGRSECMCRLPYFVEPQNAGINGRAYGGPKEGVII